ncbi:hypothetical protein BpHYR1_036355 [Brachionus plicatilis]|uniref:Uncharacterized protein n=1 Tax=Brachionus plicatilis TaxID=10195 RepID=A0A3M7QF55_BRAPC|nr:hypothetical protein BpHYR1_036355 [Brachionus plicatilis]
MAPRVGFPKISVSCMAHLVVHNLHLLSLTSKNFGNCSARFILPLRASLANVPSIRTLNNFNTFGVFVPANFHCLLNILENFDQYFVGMFQINTKHYYTCYYIFLSLNKDILKF